LIVWLAITQLITPQTFTRTEQYPYSCNRSPKHHIQLFKNDIQLTPEFATITTEKSDMQL